MTRLQETIEVPRAIDDVFRYVADFSNIEQWDPGVRASEKLTSGPVGPGTEFRVVVNSGLSPTPMNYRITHYEPPLRVILEGHGGAIHAIDDIRFTAGKRSTRIQYTADITLSGAVGLVQPLMGGLLEGVGRKAMAGLQRALSDKPKAPGESLLRNLADRMVLPGVLAFTRFGYDRSKRNWQPMVVSLDGRTVVITGATSGLGRVAAERLAGLGARVILVGRDAVKLRKARREIIVATGNEQVATERADLGLLAEVRALARRLLEQEPEIHVLVNNAAVLPGARSKTSEGLETAFATDLLSPFLLTSLLLPRLRASAPARIVNVSSGGMYLSGIDLDDLENARGSYDGSRAYARAKRGLMMLTEYWADALEGSGVVVNAMHPGWADTPGVRDSLPGFHRLTRSLLRSPEQGADTIVWLAAAPEAGLLSGKFWLDREPHLSAILPCTAGNLDSRKKLVEELSRRVAE
jgi:NAD(P)-dependent dehydrogenase (short-subunit alcohol dehydrogenase family)/carbon monoxide dehydrogenase subunit G